MAGKAYEGNFKAWLLETAPADWTAAEEGARTLLASELDAGTRLLRLVSSGGVSVTMNTNTASQALVDLGKISHNIGTREVSDVTITHERDFPVSGDDMWNLYSYGDKRYLVVSPDGVPDTDGQVLHVFEIETGEPQLQPVAQDTKQNFVVQCAVQDWDLNVTYDDGVA